MQVAKPALAFFDVGLELVSAVADTLMPRVALGELGLDKCGAVPLTMSPSKRFFSSANSACSPQR